MMFRTHEIGGMVACTAAMPLLINSGIIPEPDVLVYGLFFAGGAMGAMFPDIDSPTSKIRRGIRKVFTGDPSTEKRVINHRREPHMPLIWAVIFALCLFVFSNVFAETFIWGMMIGVASHLFLDMLNPAGIPLFGPFKRKKINILPIKTNSWGENIIAVLLVLCEIYLLFFSSIAVVNVMNIVKSIIG